eukprot:COSAG02_NODE_369_length_23680_cov_36.650609_16_plen_184_part_00
MHAESVRAALVQFEWNAYVETDGSVGAPSADGSIAQALRRADGAVAETRRWSIPSITLRCDAGLYGRVRRDDGADVLRGDWAGRLLGALCKCAEGLVVGPGTVRCVENARCAPVVNASEHSGLAPLVYELAAAGPASPVAAGDTATIRLACTSGVEHRSDLILRVTDDTLIDTVRTVPETIGL